MTAAALAVLLAAPAAGASSDATLDKIRTWPVYDARETAAIDLFELCRLARLPCGAVLAPGSTLSAPEGPVAGRTVGDLLDRVLAANPGHLAEMREGVLSIRAPGACAGTLAKKMPKARLPIRTARVAAWLALRAAGWTKAADAGLASLGGEREDARYLNVEVILHQGATARGTLDAIARGDGRMVWIAEASKSGCSGFRFASWRAPSPSTAARSSSPSPARAHGPRPNGPGGRSAAGLLYEEMRLLVLAAWLALPASAQRAVKPAALPSASMAPVSGVPQLQNLATLERLTPALVLAPSAVVPLLTPAPALVPAPAVVKAAPSAPERVAALAAGVAKAAASIGEKNSTSGDVASAGRDVEALLTGALPAASAAEPADPAISFALDAARSLAARADDLGSAKGLKAGSMTGGDFTGLLEDAAKTAPEGPTPAATAAAREVGLAITRVMRALLPKDEPLKPNLPRALAVWQVFDQEMALAAEKGGLDEVVLDARLFASQVEQSVEPAKPAEERPAITPNETPEDPEGYVQRTEPGSVFGWKPIEDSPGHGLPLLDALIRRALGAEKKSPYAEGFVLPGSAERADAKIFLYGERHTDGGLIKENMRRIVEDAEPGKPMIVLVEGYTGWSMRGWEALEYLADRGLDPEALKAKGIHGQDVEVRGWDTAYNYDASKHPLLQHHMDLLELNRLAHSDERGWSYYRKMAAAGWTAFKGWLDLWKIAIEARNKDLDDAVARAAGDADAGASVHVIAGSDHLMRSPRLAGVPWLGRPRLRPSLRAAIAGRPWRASQPANTIP
ncbi:MAG: hypothetical protein M0D55_00775 [Elusimicrobiota bacterium]|nr:MAG: hypothetical protein M0D55_00775 [Elusimicrobiota bacterium]